jgi:hypothetical protein
MRKNTSFLFLWLIIIYFSAATVIGAMWGADARFLVPMMPCIAILSSLGWHGRIGQFYKQKRREE